MANAVYYAALSGKGSLSLKRILGTIEGDTPADKERGNYSLGE
jgi:hypothetical protein